MTEQEISAGREKAVDKIKKLLALGTSPNENEAAAAVAKAQDLMFRYNLDLEDLVEQHVSEIEEHVTEFNILVTWQSRLVRAVADTSLCGLYVIENHRIINGRYTAKLDRIVVFVGRSHDVELAELILGWLMGELNRLSNLYSATLTDYTPPQRKVARRSWLEGAATTVANRLHTEFEERRQASADARALVLHSSANVQEFLEKKDLRKGKKQASARKDDWNAYAAGRQDGHRVSLRPGERR